MVQNPDDQIDILFSIFRFLFLRLVQGAFLIDMISIFDIVHQILQVLLANIFLFLDDAFDVFSLYFYFDFVRVDHFYIIRLILILFLLKLQKLNYKIENIN